MVPDSYGLVLGLPGIRHYFVRIRILSSTKQKKRKNHHFYFLLLLFDFLSWKTDVNVPSKSKKKKNFEKKFVLLTACQSLTKKAGSGFGSRSVSQLNGSADQDPYPYQNVTDPQHCKTVINKKCIYYL